MTIRTNRKMGQQFAVVSTNENQVDFLIETTSRKVFWNLQSRCEYDDHSGFEDGLVLLANIEL